LDAGELEVKTAIVTGADKKFIPGVIAFYNSLKVNGNVDCDLILFAHGKEEDFTEIPEEFKIIFNPDAVKSPTSCDLPVEIPAMYSRVMIPRLLPEYDRVIWFDADIIILQDLNPLLYIDMEDKPLAATFPGSDFQPKSYCYMPFQFENPGQYPEYAKIHSLQAGVLLFDIKKWHELDLDSKVDETLLSNIKFRFVVQGVLGYVVKGNFKKLDYKWNCYVSWTNKYKDIAVLHYVGGRNAAPWLCRMHKQEIWNQYYEYNSNI
jgi:lipopolysaccharide biosynthesis glycosyltransferase